MDYDADKVDDAVLGLLWLTAWREVVVPAEALGPVEPAAGDPAVGAPAVEVWRAWRGADWDALDRLHAAGLIADPRTKARSVVLTAEGRARAEALFRDLFGRPERDADPSR